MSSEELLGDRIIVDMNLVHPQSGGQAIEVRLLHHFLLQGRVAPNLTPQLIELRNG